MSKHEFLKNEEKKLMAKIKDQDKKLFQKFIMGKQWTSIEEFLKKKNTD